MIVREANASRTIAFLFFMCIILVWMRVYEKVLVMKVIPLLHKGKRYTLR
jgi:hypothetical protein